jgi:hypothetical protein
MTSIEPLWVVTNNRPSGPNAIAVVVPAPLA